jgi:hypothetical protein
LLNEFEYDKIIVVLVLELFRTKMDPNEKVDNFNQRLVSLINKIRNTSKRVDGVSI